MAISPGEAHQFTEAELSQMDQAEAKIDSALRSGDRRVQLKYPTLLTAAQVEELATRYIHAGWRVTYVYFPASVQASMSFERATLASPVRVARGDAS